MDIIFSLSKREVPQLKKKERKDILNAPLSFDSLNYYFENSTFRKDRIAISLIGKINGGLDIIT